DPPARPREGRRLRGVDGRGRAARPFLGRGGRPRPARPRALNERARREDEGRLVMREHFGTLAALAQGAADAFGAELEHASAIVADAVLSGRTVLAFGNGGSAKQAQHFVAELLVSHK